MSLLGKWMARATAGLPENTVVSSAEARRTNASDTLRMAAALVECTAFDQAGEQPAPVVSQLILIAADLERLAQTMSADRLRV